MAMFGMYLKFLLGVTCTFQAPLFWGLGLWCLLQKICFNWNVRTPALLLKAKRKVKRPNLNLSPTWLCLHLPGDSLDCTYERSNKSSQIIIHLPVNLWFPKMTSRFSALQRSLMCPEEVTTWRTWFTFFSWFMMLGRIPSQKLRETKGLHLKMARPQKESGIPTTNSQVRTAVGFGVPGIQPSNPSVTTSTRYTLGTPRHLRYQPHWAPAASSMRERRCFGNPETPSHISCGLKKNGWGSGKSRPY